MNFSFFPLVLFNFFSSRSISQKTVSTVAVNPSGEWLAFGCSSVGQLLVWEWQSESYILKQQGHFYDMNVLAYSPDGQIIVTGGDDGKVCKCLKLYIKQNINNHACRENSAFPRRHVRVRGILYNN